MPQMLRTLPTERPVQSTRAQGLPSGDPRDSLFVGRIVQHSLVEDCREDVLVVHHHLPQRIETVEPVCRAVTVLGEHHPASEGATGTRAHR